MRALAIDTSTDIPAVALCDGPTCVARTPDAPPASPSAAVSPAVPQQHAERLLGIIDETMKRASWTRADVELVACCIGPGSFTGVRVGVATAKGIALGLGIPIVGVGSLEAMAYAHRVRLAGAADPKRALVPLLDARKSEIYWAAYADDGALLAGPGHVAVAQVADLAAWVPRQKITFLGGIAARLALDPATVVTDPSSDHPDALAIALLAQTKLSERGPDDLDALEPAYVRPPDITLPATSS